MTTGRGDRVAGNASGQSERADLLATMRSGIALVVVAMVLAGSITFFLQATSAPRYRAEATLLLTSGAAEGLSENRPLLAPRLSAETYRTTIPTPAVWNFADHQAPFQMARGRVDVTVDHAGLSALLHVRARSEDPEEARALANAVAEAAISWDVQRARDVAQERAEALEKQIAQLSAQRAEVASALRSARLDRMIDERRTQLDTVRMLELAADSPLRLLQSATTPESPVAPRPVRNAILVALIAAIAAVGAILIGRTVRRA